jgi:hypothetical protein
MTAPTPINPLLQAFLPQMIERLTVAQREVGDILRPISVDMAALADFLDYEVGRTELELSKAEWASQADTEALQSRIRYLRGLRAGVDAGGAASVLGPIEEVLVILRRLRSESD